MVKRVSLPSPCRISTRASSGEWKPAQVGFGHKELEEKKVEEGLGAQGTDTFPWFTGYIDHSITQWFGLVWFGRDIKYHLILNLL